MVFVISIQPIFHELRRRLILRNWSAAMHKHIKIEVKQGCLIGSELRTSNGIIFHSYKGIPYAVPPLGKLRYRSPIPLEKFDCNELDCTKERNISHQRDPISLTIMGSEDCLFLNVYTPASSSGPLPVLVYIHGGGFWFGSGNSDFFYPERFMEENVVVVTINYRLGALGFLCLPEEGIYGNAGLKDQRLALQWVQENIGQFKGDPRNVTICGESAGAASVHLHTCAAHAKQLFHKAILQSGTANMEWVFQSNPAYKTQRMAELLNFKSSNTREILTFLQSSIVTPLDLYNNTLKVLSMDEKRRGLPLTFKPVIEDVSSPDSFISRPILDILKQPNQLHVPVIMGYNSAEGLAMTVNALQKLQQIDKDLERFVPRNLPLLPENHKSEIKMLASKMRDFYFAGQKIDTQQLDALTELLTDYHFNIDMQNAAEWQAKLQPAAPLYFYRFNYVGKRNLYKKITQFEHLRGACHGDELFYLFQMANDNRKLNDEDLLCSQRLCRLWANFARYNQPTVGVEMPIINFQWTPVKKPSNANEPFELDFLEIGQHCEMRCNPERKRIEFWRDIYSGFESTDFSRVSAKL